MTREERDTLRALCKAATPGPWVVCRETDEFGTIGTPVVQMYDDEALVVGGALDFGDVGTLDVAAEQRWFEHAPPLVVRALDALDAVEARLKANGVASEIEAVETSTRLHAALAVKP